jgi:hypothetical protein
LMEMAVRSMETAETVMETDGDGSGGTSLSRQGAGTETSVSRNLSVAAAELRNSFWKIVESPRVFRPEALYRRRGGAWRGTRCPHMAPAWPGPWPRRACVRGPGGPPLRLPFGCLDDPGKNKTFGFCFIQFREYFLCITCETQK